MNANLAIQRNWQHRAQHTKKTHNTISVGHHYVQANTNNVNKTWTFLQTTASKPWIKRILHKRTRGH